MSKEKVLEFREKGLFYGEISKLLDMPRSSVISIVKRLLLLQKVSRGKPHSNY